MVFRQRTWLWLGYLAILVLVVMLHQTPLSSFIDHRALDIQYQVLNQQDSTQAVDIVVVGIDAKSFEVFRESLVLWYGHLGKFMHAMAVAQPSVVGINFAMPSKSFDFILPGIDEKLLTGLDTLKAAVPFVIAQTRREDGSIRPMFAPISSRLGADNLGMATLTPDTDGKVRHVQTRQFIGQSEHSTFNASLAAQLGIEARNGLIDYARSRPMSYIPLPQVIALYDAGETERLRLLFQGKAVLFGSVLHFIDRHKVPVLLAKWEPGNFNTPGVLIQAQALQSQINGTVISPLPGAIYALVVLLFSSAWWLGRKAIWAPSLTLLAIVIYFGVGTMSLWHGVYLPVFTATVAGLLSVMGRMGLEYAYARQEKSRLQDSFGRYVSPQVLDDIVEGRITPGMEGKSYYVCVLFSDIRNFTKRSEGQDPKDIIGLLNRYFNEMTKAVHQHGGTVDKFIGDGLMAFFGAPMQQDNPAANAFSAAKEMLERLQSLNRLLDQEGIEPIAIGVGLHVGKVIVGHVGSDDRHEYTVIGDTVNVASRLEGVTKQVGYPVVCSKEVQQAIGEGVFDDCGKQVIKGHTPVTVYGWKPA